MSRILWLLGSVLVIAAVTLGLGWKKYSDFMSEPLAIPANGIELQVMAGSTGRKIVNQLDELQLTDKGWPWQLLMRLQPRVYHAGEFQLKAGMTPPEVLAHLASGDVISYRVTLVEGWTASQALAQLATDPVLIHELAESPADELPDLVAGELGVDYLEGWFLPETYVFTRGDTDRDILRRAHRAMEKALEEAWQARNTGLPLETPYELLILASIIEKETALDEERDQIAGVFVRRLQKRMRLQTDPTVIYGMGDAFDGDIRRKDLTTDTPYNTYTRHGLPPTPIALPSKASLMAAGTPADGDALYFVADGKGGHVFSATLEEHNAAVRRYLETRG